MNPIGVYKYPIKCNSVAGGAHEINVEMPLGAKPLCVHTQDGQACIWAEVDVTETRKMVVKFVSVGTGHGRVPKGAAYLGTVLEQNYVWHIYRVK